MLRVRTEGCEPDDGNDGVNTGEIVARSRRFVSENPAFEPGGRLGAGRDVLSKASARGYAKFPPYILINFRDDSGRRRKQITGEPGRPASDSWRMQRPDSRIPPLPKLANPFQPPVKGGLKV